MYVVGEICGYIAITLVLAWMVDFAFHPGRHLDGRRRRR